MGRPLLAALVYFAMVFVVGFALGAVRIPLLTPIVGDVAATLLELPVMLAASWLASGWVTERLDIRSPVQALVMGTGAFALLMGAEAGGAMLLFGRSLGDHFASYARPAGAIGLAGQALFGLIPALRRAMDGSQGKAAPDDTAHRSD